MALSIHIANSAKRDATILFTAIHPPAPPKMGLKNREVTFHRYLAAGREGLHDAMQKKHGDDYGQALVDGDPEIDMENVGRALSRSNVVYLSSKGEVLYASPKEVEIISNPDGTERERRDPQDTPGNVNDEVAPVHWTGRKLKKEEAVHKFVFQRSVQLRHIDGLTFDFLHAMAKELHDEGVVVLLGAGPKGKDPLIFYSNGSPYRGFLEGRVDGDRYLLLLRLSHLELKCPKD
ncbi:hypothetical protein ACFL6C_01025 [Myxococcota bacterium]